MAPPRAAFAPPLPAARSRATAATGRVAVSALPRRSASLRRGAARRRVVVVASAGGGRSGGSGGGGGAPSVSRAAVEAYCDAVTSGSKLDKDRLRNLLDVTGVTPAEAQLLLAARMGDAPTVTALLAAGVNVNVPDAEGSTPLMRAASRGHVDAVAAVLGGPAPVDVGAVNAWGYDAMIYLGSVRSSQPAAYAAIEAMLADAGGDVERVGLRWSQRPEWRRGERS